jgi:subtilisin family serine protease
MEERKRKEMKEGWSVGMIEGWTTMVRFLKKYPLLVLLVVLAIVSALVLYISRQPKLSVTCKLVDQAAPYSAKDYEEDPEAQFLLRDQVIVTGPQSEVDKVVEPGDPDTGLKLVEYCNLSYRGAPDLYFAPEKSFPFPRQASSRLTMRLYQISDGRPVWEVVEAINQAGRDLHVFADPNYLTGLLTGESPCGLPNSDAGSPFESVSSSPATAELFWRQWAFEHVGVGSPLQDTLQGTSINPTGAGVRVGVFDTSPFTPTAAASVGDAGGVHTETIQVVTPTLELKVSYPEMRSLTAADPETATDVRDHGLFVAGLIHAVAPDSDVRLIRVLNQYGCGDLFTLNKALYRFIAEMETERGMLDGTVINLSLGVLKPASDDVESTDQEVITIDDSLEVLAQDTVESLRAAVLLAHSRGAVVVAAAGNDSYVKGKPLPPQIPAKYPFVIGVAGSNVYRGRACFSNWGDVSAPSGDARSDGMPGPCEPRAIECSGDCDEAVISLVRSPDMDYAYWRGTSFSAPLVSGLAALILDAGASQCICRSSWVHPNEVFEAIRCGAPTSGGVINVPATLLRCIP